MKSARAIFAGLAVVLIGALTAFAMAVPGVVAQDDATPVAAAVDATPVAEPIRVITLVAWYETDASEEFIQIGPLASNDQMIAGPGDATTALTGTADFDGPDDDGVPRIELGDSSFDGQEAFTDDPTSMFRWTYPEGDATFRPATLVLQVEAVAGPYDGFEGSATFVSRSSPGSGVLVIMLNPPDEE